MIKGRENKPHIGIFGRRNNGKSSMINALIGQDVAIVSEIAGTTTDPVKKSVEIHGIGPVIMVDTAGIDDTGDLGKLRIQKTTSIIDQIDLAILVITDNLFDSFEDQLIRSFQDHDLPCIVVYNKIDLSHPSSVVRNRVRELTNISLVEYSALDPDTYNSSLLRTIKERLPSSVYQKQGLLGDLLSYGDIVLLITPIDIEAPEGRLILPQIQVIRDILDNEGTAIVLKEREVDSFLKKTGIKPKLVITDSQVFLKADASIPRDIPLTSFSIVLARQKGDFAEYIKGTPKIAELKDGDRVLLLESCSHHVSCDDIGRVKIPRWISNFTGKNIQYDTVAGLDMLPRPMEEYALVVQCGGCMITHRQLVNRLRGAKAKHVPITNYGMAIAFVHGIFNRAIEPFVGKLDASDDLI
jgi:[FeFe] hydrogenase H-cluster maturation GTPase HydF